MATLEDKILGEKLHYYCSSSEDEQEEEIPQTNSQNTITDWDGSCVNTGPKGVIKDWQRYRQLQTEQRQEQERELQELAKKLSLTCKPESEEQKEKLKEEELEKELAELLDDDFLKQYMQKRMEELYSRPEGKAFGKLISLGSGGEFLDAIDKENKDVTIIVHLYEDTMLSCDAMNGCLTCLAQEYPRIKFCKLKATTAGVSKHFKSCGVPALLVYKGGHMIGNFVSLSDEFGDDFFADTVESFLIQHGILPDKNIPLIIRSRDDDSSDDSDYDVE